MLQSRSLKSSCVAILPLLGGLLIPREESAGHVGLARLRFSDEEVEQYINTRADRREESPWIIAGVKRLGIKAEVARFLASKELIETNASKDQGKISKPFTREGLLLFESKYSFAIDVAQELGITTSFLIQRLQTLNVRPVSGKAVDGGPHYVLRRVDLESVDLKKLSTMFPRKKTKKNLIRQVVHGGNRIALKRTPSKTGPYILRCYPWRLQC